MRFLWGESFIDGRAPCLILGDNIFYGHSLSQNLQSACRQTAGATVFAYHVSDPGALRRRRAG